MLSVIVNELTSHNVGVDRHLLPPLTVLAKLAHATHSFHTRRHLAHLTTLWLNIAHSYARIIAKHQHSNSNRHDLDVVCPCLSDPSLRLISLVSNSDTVSHHPRYLSLRRMNAFIWCVFKHQCSRAWKEFHIRSSTRHSLILTFFRVSEFLSSSPRLWGKFVSSNRTSSMRWLRRDGESARFNWKRWKHEKKTS